MTSPAAPAPLARVQAGLLAAGRWALRHKPLALLFLASAYLTLVNLDYAHLWHDEGNTVAVARGLLTQGDIIGWDGRSLVAGTNGKSLNADLREIQPPLMYFVTAASIAVFGDSPAGARALHAIIGVLALLVFGLLLRQHMPRQPRLMLLCFAFAALSAQLMLYHRNARYFAMALLLFLLAAWLHRRYLDGRRGRDAALLALVGVLGVFNHYAVGLTVIAALGTHHLLWHVRATRLRDWLLLGGGAAAAGALLLAWVAWLGAFSREGGLLEFSGADLTENPLPYWRIILLRYTAYLKTAFQVDWLGWPICLWFAGCLFSQLRAKDGQGGWLAPEELRPVCRLVILGLLVILYAAVFSVQPSYYLGYSDLRYFFISIPLLLMMKAAFVHWLLKRSTYAGAAAAVALIASSVSAYPFNLVHQLDQEPTLELHLLSYVKEVHRPYRDPVTETLRLLDRHAAPGATVYTPRFQEHDALVAAAGHRYRFCCQLSPTTPHARQLIERIGDPVQSQDPHTADWIIFYHVPNTDPTEHILHGYSFWDRSEFMYYPAHRPELNYHLFAPIRIDGRNEITLLRGPHLPDAPRQPEKR
ncbi:MAG: glycosyltransferase family 39 protein [Betaproteobacteria bacterium AqS2]|uniref:Glycosyltransferase family 39 protein n=1 Tax=Candidatus Amphirhobacter heronislandensis TaxID=1732024 RepID=A0A930Y1G0_9GAMM|nr:glycosyltransferase family 39 protein [Betaproteobacteria bacterium AqS2]